MPQDIPAGHELKPDDYLKLWMYFQDRADNAKEAMFKIVTWTIGLAALILGFIFANLVSFEPIKASITLTFLVATAAAAGLVICLYSWFMLSEGGKHIQSNWDRARRCENHINNKLGIIIRGDSTGEKEERGIGTPIAIWNQLRIIVCLFGIAFIGVLIWQSLGAINCG
jgi:hypothetical protein